jgi:hypothetical protein
MWRICSEYKEMSSILDGDSGEEKREFPKAILQR